MGSIRITQGIMIDRVLSNIRDQELRILALQNQLATGLKINKISDNPLAARRGIASQSEIRQNEQYLTNISTVSPYLRESETSILTVVDILQRANELTLQGSNSTNAQEQRDQLALEINQLLEATLVESNHQTNGRFIFAGTRTLATPFAETRDANNDITAVTYNGNDENIEMETSENVRVIVNETGQAVFQENIDVFQVLIDIRDSLRTGDFDGLTTGLVELDTAQEQLLVSTARIGSIENRINRTDTNIRDINVQLEEVLSDNIDADFAEVIVELNAQSNAFQASLNAAGRIIQPSLLDFIR